MSMPAFKTEDAAMTAPARPKLYSVEDAKNLDVNTVKDLFTAHINPGQVHFLKLLGFDKILVDRAEGMHYITKDGRKILDFFGGFCSVAFGHNHPRIIAGRQKFQDENRHEICMAFMSQYASALAANLAAISPGDLDMVFLGSTGSEAMEAALKVAEQAQGPGALEDPARRELLPRQDQGRALGHRFHALPVAVQAGRQPGQGALRRHRGRPAGAGKRPGRSASS
jgi:4-aminobutyrate aminotransferase-like enzyme